VKKRERPKLEPEKRRIILRPWPSFAIQLPFLGRFLIRTWLPMPGWHRLKSWQVYQRDPGSEREVHRSQQQTVLEGGGHTTPNIRMSYSYLRHAKKKNVKKLC
jgi:hypothetical protein